MRRLRNARHDHGGYTLFELLITMVVIGILAALVAPFVRSTREERDVLKTGQPNSTPTPTQAPDPVTSSSGTHSVDIPWASIFGIIGAFIAVLIATYIGYLIWANWRTKANAQQALQRRWDLSLEKHQKIAEEYAVLLVDPVKSLTHSALWDVNNARTLRFINAYGELQDVASLWGTKLPTDIETIDRYEKACRETETIWADARKHAAMLGYQWMPKADAAKAHKATGLLRKAADSAASDAERDLAASKAQDLIAKIGAVHLPEQAMAAIAGTRRLQLVA